MWSELLDLVFPTSILLLFVIKVKHFFTNFSNFVFALSTKLSFFLFTIGEKSFMMKSNGTPWICSEKEILEMTTEELLKKIILSNYGTMTKFSDAAGLPYTSLMSVLNRGVKNSGLKNVSKICATLGISTDDLCEGRIVFAPREGQRVNLEGVLAFLRAQLDAGQVDLDAKPVDGEEAKLVCLLLDSVEDMVRKSRKGCQS